MGSPGLYDREHGCGYPLPARPLLGVLSCLLLMCSMPAENWLRLALWFAVGMAIYFLYGRRHSRLKGTAA